MKLLTKTWFTYSLLLYGIMALSIDHFAANKCTREAGFKHVHSHRAFVTGYVFIAITTVTLLAWSIVRYKVIRQATHMQNAGMLEALIGPSDREGADSAEEVLVMICTAFFSCLMRLSVLIGMFLFLATNCMRNETILFVVFLIFETLAAVAFFYYGSTDNHNTNDDTI